LNHSLSLLLALIFIASPTLTKEARGNGALPPDNLNYPVLIIGANGETGSGFYLNSETDTFLVTARHVLLDDSGLFFRSDSIICISYPLNPSEEGDIVISLDLLLLKVNRNLKAHDTEDVAVIKIGDVKKELPAPDGKMAIKFVAGVNLKRATSSGILGVGIQNVKRFSDISVSNDAFVFGYPTSLGLADIPQIQYERPLIRKGVIAGKNKPLKTIILDLPVYKGNSGGPVVEVEDLGLSKKLSLIGVVSQMIPSRDGSNSGYAVAIPIDPVLELVNSY
jgi:S1-C subfamily serine protease